MPTYEYKCNKCGHEFEAFQSMSADPLTDCDKCGTKGSVERVISGGAGLIFKGSGFYITDYRDSSYKSAADKDKSSGSKSSGSSDSKKSSDSKPSKPSSGGDAKASTKAA